MRTKTIDLLGSILMLWLIGMTAVAWLLGDRVHAAYRRLRR